MAVRHDPSRRKPWRVYYRNPITGCQETKDFETREEADLEDARVKERLENDRDSFRPPDSPDAPAPEYLTFQEAAILYLREKQPDRKKLVWLLGCWKIALEMMGNLLLAEVTTEHLKRLRTEEMETGVSMTTVRCHLSMVRAVLNWAVDMGYLAQPIHFPKFPQVEPKVFIPPTREELDRLIAVTPPHVQRVLLLGYYLGARTGPSELFSLRWSLVNFDKEVITVVASKKNKSCPWREVPLNSKLLAFLREWHRQDMLEGSGDFIINYNGKPVKSIKTAWYKALKHAGIDRHLRLTDLRHAFASNLLRNGGDVGTVAQLMGHSSPTMLLKHYQYVCSEQKRSAVESIE